jgi:hypothetical protein
LTRTFVSLRMTGESELTARGDNASSALLFWWPQYGSFYLFQLSISRFHMNSYISWNNILVGEKNHLDGRHIIISRFFWDIRGIIWLCYEEMTMFRFLTFSY